jgi:transposase
MVLHRDVNAARNLAMLVDLHGNRVARSGLETGKTPVDGDLRPAAGSSSTEREAGTEPPDLGQTGTADW